MEQNISLQAFLKEILEPIIDECLTRAMNKYMNMITLVPHEHPDVMDVSETSKYLKLAKPTIYSKVQARRIPHYKQGKRLYFRKEDLDQWINSGKIKTMDEINADAIGYINRKGRRSS